MNYTENYTEMRKCAKSLLDRTIKTYQKISKYIKNKKRHENEGVGFE
jgi:hypothetical protein|tara:strand:+ start:33 stop:173 length:141 start_codon:yes stop_codon:yes gene_type:complete